MIISTAFWLIFMSETLTLGSLFDGSGGFPLAGKVFGIEPIWASEIEPFPIAVTKKRFPNMKHYGNVCEIDGGKVEPVDILTFGSPCTNLSMAGNREGLKGSQSQLFFEAIRIIKKMRKKTNGEKPRYIIFENVSGAFSSNKGEDFRTILEQLCKVKDDEISIPKSEKWEHSGQIVADNFSLCWRQFDAKYWGVAQRRKRLFIVCDYRGECAGKILLESDSVSRYFEKSFGAWQNDARDVTGCTEDTIGNVNNDISAIAIENHPADSRIKICEDNIVQALTSRMGTGGNNVPLVLVGDVYGIGRDVFNSGKNAQYVPSIDKNIQPTLVAKGPGAVAYSTANKDAEQVKGIIRRLTPSECAKLQGFPANWCSDIQNENPTDEDIEFWTQVFNTYCEINGLKRKDKKSIIRWIKDPHSDSAEYKMWGNGVALPCVMFIMAGILWCYENGFNELEIKQETKPFLGDLWD